MLKKTITYTDYNENKRTEDFYFHLTKAEITEMEMSIDGGLQQSLQKIVDTQNAPAIISEFKKIVLKAYGVKSDDGRRFIKTPEVKAAFAETEAYSIMFMSLFTDANAAAEFVRGVMPADLQPAAASALMPGA